MRLNTDNDVFELVLHINNFAARITADVLLGVQKLFVSTNPADPIFCADPTLCCVFGDDFRATI